jgi:hypothetical protein
MTVHGGEGVTTNSSFLNQVFGVCDAGDKVTALILYSGER